MNISRWFGYSCTGPYDVPNVKGDLYCVYTNHPIGSAMRGFGDAGNPLGPEQMLDRLAEAIGRDPADFKRQNCVRPGDVILTGMIMPNVICRSALTGRQGRHRVGAGERPFRPAQTPGQGPGDHVEGAGHAAQPRQFGDRPLQRGRHAQRLCFRQEIGQGAFTVAAQMAAEALGIPFEWVRVSANPVDTKYSPYEWQTVASRLTWSMGNAVKAAAEHARAQILDIVAKYWNEDRRTWTSETAW